MVEKNLRIHYLQHIPFEGLGFISDWIEENKFTVSSTKFFENDLISFDEKFFNSFDWMIIMGGPMSVNDENKYQWLKQEKLFIEKAIAKNKTVIGICLGAQLIANVLGSKIYKNNFKEIGWFDIELTAEGKQNKIFKDFPDKTKVFHWHGETFELPKDAIHIAKSEACNNQAFVYDNRVIGLQFHLEMNKKSINELIINAKDDITEGKFVQTEEEMKEKIHLTKNTNKLMVQLLDKLNHF